MGIPAEGDPLAAARELSAAVIRVAQERAKKRKAGEIDVNDKKRGPFMDGRQTLAHGVVASADGTEELVGAQNKASGLVSKQFRTQPDGTSAAAGVKYYSLTKRRILNDVEQIVPNGDVTRENRHAEMSLVAYSLALHLKKAPGNTTETFRLEDWLLDLEASREMCLECQLALAVLSPGFGRILQGITNRVMQPGEPPVLVLRPLCDAFSKKWAPPWPRYHWDLQKAAGQSTNSDYFRDREGKLRADRTQGKFVIGFEGNHIIVGKYNESEKRWVWDKTNKIGQQHG